MPLFLIIAGWFNSLGRNRVKVLLGFAATIIVIGGALFSLTDHISIGLGIYWAITTATTVGYGDVIAHHTSSRIVAAVVMLTVIPTLGAVFALVAGASVLTRIRRLFGMDTALPADPYAIVFGTHHVIARVLDELSRAGDPVVLVAPEQPPGMPDGVHFLAGDPTDEALVLKCELHRATRALIACDAEADTLVIAVAIHSIAPELEVFALTQSRAVARALRELGVTQTLAADELVGHTVAKSLETPQAGSLLLQLIDNASYRLTETAVDPSLVAQRLSSARAMADALVLGIARGNQVDLGLVDDPLLSADDRLIVLRSVPAASAG
jgi:voltage-gated potassium channel